MAVKRDQSGLIFVFSAPSGAGKTTILDYLREKNDTLVYSISATTRKPRTGEIDGTHYFFLSEKDFERKIDNNEFAEWAVVHGNYYGTPKSFIDSTVKSGKHIVMDIDVFGKKKFDLVYPNAIGILILPPSLDTLEKRLRNRNTEDEKTLQVRLQNARTEIDFASKEGKYEHTIVNDNLEKAKQETLDLIQRLTSN